MNTLFAKLKKMSWRKGLINLLVIFFISIAFLPFVYNGTYDSPQKTIIVVFWSFAIFVTQFLGHGYIIEYLDKKISWVKRPVFRATVGIVCIVVYASVAFIAVDVLMNLLFFQYMPYDSILEALDSSRYAIGIAFIISLILTSAGFLRAWKNSEVAKEQLKTQIVTHRYNALREQINPHFLFNSLNVLTDLVYEDQDLAVKFIRQMSDLYRYVLMARNEDAVELSREKEFAESFAFLLKTRFENGLNINLDFKVKSNEQFVPMALQLLIENAVKHNEASMANPLTIDVSRSGDYLIVENNIQPKAKEEDSTKQGLENLKNRYAFLSDKTLEVKKTETTFEVKLPILTLER